jgi:hypothetical protein
VAASYVAASYVAASNVAASYVAASYMIVSPTIARCLGGYRLLNLFCTKTSQIQRLVRSANHLALTIPLQLFATNNETPRGRT